MNADDLIDGPITVTIVGARRGDAKQPVFLDIEGRKGKPFKPCKTMLRVMAEVWQDKTETKFDPKRWIGQSMTLYREPSVTYKGIEVGGIRISHVSGIDKPRTFMLTKSRGQKAELTIHPIAAISPEDQKYITEATDLLNKSDSLDELKGHGSLLKTKSKGIQDALRPIYAKRRDELTVPE